MLRLQLSKLAKTLIVISLYITSYILLSTMLTPETVYNFVSDEFRVGDKYVLIYLIGKAPVISDVVGADIFRSRHCGVCFITNNKGFLPISEYDAVVVHGDKKLLAEDSSAAMEPHKRYLLEADTECLERKLMGCDGVKFTSFANKKTYNFCSLCAHLSEQRQRAKWY